MPNDTPKENKPKPESWQKILIDCTSTTFLVSLATVPLWPGFAKAARYSLGKDPSLRAILRDGKGYLPIKKVSFKSPPAWLSVLYLASFNTASHTFLEKTTDSSLIAGIGAGISSMRGNLGVAANALGQNASFFHLLKQIKSPRFLFLGINCEVLRETVYNALCLNANKQLKTLTLSDEQNLAASIALGGVGGALSGLPHAFVNRFYAMALGEEISIKPNASERRGIAISMGIRGLTILTIFTIVNGYEYGAKHCSGTQYFSELFKRTSQTPPAEEDRPDWWS